MATKKDARPLCYGDSLTLFQVEQSGFVACDGFDTIRTFLSKTSTDKYVENIDEAVLQFHPAFAYEKFISFRATCEQQGIDFDQDLNLFVPDDVAPFDQSALKAPVLAERKRNNERLKRALGTTVHFGDSVQIFHVKSGKYILVDLTVLSNFDKKAYGVLVKQCDEAAVWKVSCRFKLNTDGQPVRGSDSVILCNVLTKTYLLSNPSFSVGLNRTELCSLASAPRMFLGFQVRAYSSYVTPSLGENPIDQGAPFRFYNLESQAALVVDPNTGGLRFVPMRRAALRQHTSSLFVIQAEHNTLGGPVLWEERYRIFHLTTRRFLTYTIGTPTQAPLTITSTTDPSKAGTFKLRPLYDSDKIAREDEVFMLCTLGSLRFVVPDSTQSDISATLSQRAGPSNALTCFLADRVWVRNLFRAQALFAQSTIFCSQVKEGTKPDGKLCRKLRTILSDAILSVTSGSTDPNILTRLGIVEPIFRDALVDCGLVDVLATVVHSPFTSGLIPVDGSNRPQDSSLRQVTLLANRLLFHCVRGNTFAGKIASSHMDHLETLLGKDLKVEELFAAVMRDNPEVLSQCSDTRMNTFVSLITHKGRQSAFVELLTTTTCCGDLSINANQLMIDKFLFERNIDTFLNIHTAGNEIVLTNEQGDVVPLIEFVQASSAQLNNFLAAVLRLIAGCCTGRNETCVSHTQERFTLDSLVQVVVSEQVPFSVRGAALQLALKAFIDVNPNSLKAYVNTLVVWGDLSAQSEPSINLDSKKFAGKFDQLKHFVMQALRQHKVMCMEHKEENAFILEIARTVRFMVMFGLFSAPELRSLVAAIVDIADGRTDIVAEDGGRSEERFLVTDSSLPVMHAKAEFLDTLQLIRDSFSNERLRRQLVVAKEILESTRSFRSLTSNTAPVEHHKLGRRARNRVCDRIRHAWDVSEWDEPTLMKVCLDLLSYQDDDLVSKSIDVMLEHYNLKVETHDALEQLQILVSDDMVNMYKLSATRVAMMADLMRGGVQSHDEALLKEIVDDFSAACALSKQNQDILRALGAHTIAVQALKHLSADQLDQARSVYRFLIYLVRDCKENQVALFESLDVFLAQCSFAAEAPLLIREIFRDNRTLCNQVDKVLVDKLLSAAAFNAACFGSLAVICNPEGKGITEIQVTIFEGILASYGTPSIPDFLDPSLPERLDSASADPKARSSVELFDRITYFAQLLTALTAGSMDSTEARISRILSMHTSAMMFKTRTLPMQLRQSVVEFFEEAFVLTDRKVEYFVDVAEPNPVVDIVRAATTELLEARASSASSSSTIPDATVQFVKSIISCVAHILEQAFPQLIGVTNDAQTNLVVRFVEATATLADVSELGDKLTELMSILEAEGFFASFSLGNLHDVLTRKLHDNNPHRTISLTPSTNPAADDEFDAPIAPSHERLVQTWLEEFSSLFEDTMCHAVNDFGDTNEFVTLVEWFTDNNNNNTTTGNASVSSTTGGTRRRKGRSADAEISIFDARVKQLVHSIMSPVKSSDDEQKQRTLNVLAALARVEDENGSVQRAQTRLLRLGVMDMVLDMIVRNEKHNVLNDVVNLGIALLENGNPVVQGELARFFRSTNSEEFFAATNALLHESLSEAAELSIFYKRLDELRATPEASKLDEDELIAASNPPKEIAATKQMLRFIQVMCEGHFLPIQTVLLQQQGHVREYNILGCIVNYLVALLQFGVTYNNIDRAIQAINTITEACQGPCKQNQEYFSGSKLAVVCNMLLRNPFDPPSVLSQAQVDELLQNEADLKSAIADCLMSLLEGCRTNVVPKGLVRELEFASFRDILVEGYEEVHGSDNNAVPGVGLLKSLASLGRDVEVSGHALTEMAFQCYFVLQQLSTFVPAVNSTMASWEEDVENMKEIIEFYEERTGRIEIIGQNGVERVYFRVPDVCFQLTEDTKNGVVWSLNRSSTTMKVQDFTERFPRLEREMQHMMRLERAPRLFAMFFELRAYRMQMKQIVLFLALLVNLLTLSTWVLKDKTLQNENGDLQDYSWDTLTSLVNRCIFNNWDFDTDQFYPGPEGTANPNSDCTTWWNSLNFVDAGIKNSTPAAHTAQFIMALIVAILQSIMFWLYGAQFFGLIIAAAWDDTYGGRLSSLLRSRNPMHKLKLALTACNGLLRDKGFSSGLIFVVFGWLGLTSPVFNIIHLFVMVELSSDLQHVFSAVTINGPALLKTTALGLAICYIFSIIAFTSLRKHFIGNNDPVSVKVYCGTLFQCAATTVSLGPRKYDLGFAFDPQSSEFGHVGIYFFLFLFCVGVLVIFLQIIFGIIIDSFRELRAQHLETLADIQEVCPISGISREVFDKHGNGFEHHIEKDQNMWNYLFFYVHLLEKDPNNYNGPELHVYRKLFNDKPDFDFYPIGTSIDLVEYTNKLDEELRGADNNILSSVQNLKTSVENHTEAIRDMQDALRVVHASWDGLVQKRVQAVQQKTRQ